MKTLFVTVGTTLFDNLIESVCSDDVIKVLEIKQYGKVVIQTGKGTFIPPTNISKTISIEHFTFKDTITEDIQNADLIISHAGAGSILQALSENKPLIVVINEDLMNNHQQELAIRLDKSKHLISCTTKTLKEAVAKVDEQQFKRLAKLKKQEKFTSFLNVAMGLA